MLVRRSAEIIGYGGVLTVPVLVRTAGHGEVGQMIEFFTTHPDRDCEMFDSIKLYERWFVCPHWQSGQGPYAQGSGVTSAR